METPQPISPMSKFKIKEGVSGKAKVTYRVPGKIGMVQVILEQATQKQLGDLAAIGHPFVVAEEKKVDKKAPTS